MNLGFGKVCLFDFKPIKVASIEPNGIGLAFNELDLMKVTILEHRIVKRGSLEYYITYVLVFNAQSR